MYLYYVSMSIAFFEACMFQFSGQNNQHLCYGFNTTKICVTISMYCSSYRSRRRTRYAHWKEFKDQIVLLKD